MVCRTAVTAKHDVLHAGKTGQSLNIGIVRLQSHGICKEEKIINFPVHNARAHLLVTAQRTGFENGKIPFDIGMLLFQCCQNKGSRSTRTIELMPHKQFRIPKYPLYEVFLHGIMRHQANLSNQFFHKQITFTKQTIKNR
jgi:hypothetical protein